MMRTRSADDFEDLPRQELDLEDLSKLRVIARLEARKSHSMAANLAKNIESPLGKSVAAILVEGDAGKGKRDKPRLRAMARELVRTVG
jgi:hypothetical protein